MFENKEKEKGREIKERQRKKGHHSGQATPHPAPQQVPGPPRRAAYVLDVNAEVRQIDCWALYFSFMILSRNYNVHFH